MKPVKKLVLQLTSNGSLLFCSQCYQNPNSIIISEKDNKNSYLHKKLKKNVQTKSSVTYKNKYIV